jgi:phage gpG-like protein
MRFRLSKKSEELLAQLPNLAAEPIGKCGAMAALRVIEDSKRAFDVANKGTPESGYREKWEKWAPSTEKGYKSAGLAKRRAKRMSRQKRAGKAAVTHSLLYLTGALVANIVAGYAVEGKERARIKAGVTGRVPYGPAHQEGAPGRNLPARPFVGITPDGIKAIKEFFAANVKAAVGGKGEGGSPGGAPSYWSAK